METEITTEGGTGSLPKIRTGHSGVSLTTKELNLLIPRLQELRIVVMEIELSCAKNSVSRAQRQENDAKNTVRRLEDERDKIERTLEALKREIGG